MSSAPEDPNRDDSMRAPPFLQSESRPLKRERRLPHWELGGAFHFITWRLFDSLPQEKLILWRQERAAWLAEHPRPWDARTSAEYRDRFPSRLERWLDAGYGSCLLRDAGCADIVCGNLHYFDGQTYDLAAFVVMPNHVHALIQLRETASLKAVTHSWKSYTAHEINKSLARSGSVWQEESWDHILRSMSQLSRCLSYIRLNPALASLKGGEFRHYESLGFDWLLS